MGPKAVCIPAKKKFVTAAIQFSSPSRGGVTASAACALPEPGIHRSSWQRGETVERTFQHRDLFVPDNSFNGPM